MALGSPVSSPQSPGFPGSSYPGPPLHSLSISSPTHHTPSYQPYGHQTPQQQPTPQHTHTQANQSGFLPSYLMGDPVLSSPTNPGSHHHRPMVSPNKLNRSLSMQQQQNPSSAPQTPLPAHSLRGPQLLKENSSSMPRSSRDKPGGPPTNSLLFTPNRSISTPNNFQNSIMSPSPSSITSPQEVEATSNPSPMDTWVTVWGFPPSSVSFILSELSMCGTVLQHVMPPNSNWMHVRFQTRMQANKAVAKNGCVLGGSIMVGICSCKDETVLDNLNTSTVLDNSILSSSVANLSTGLGTPRTIRPLAQAYKEAQVENKVVPGTNTPSKNNGLVSKAMGCMFGW